jgi:hypothetical protein
MPVAIRWQRVSGQGDRSDATQAVVVAVRRAELVEAAATRRVRVGLLALAVLSVGAAGRPAIAATIARHATRALAQPTDPAAEREATLMVKVVPRSKSGVFRDTALVYLAGRIDSGAPDRLSRALDGVKGKTAVWLNSPGGNLFAGMQLGRIIRRHGASTHIINARTLLPGECYSACSLAFLGGIYRFNDNGAHYGVHRASLGSAAEDADRSHDLSAAVASYIREMGVDTRLLDLWMKAAPDEMYVLSRKEAEDLGVVNNGRRPPEWNITASGGGSRLQGRQATIDGIGTVSFACDAQQTVLESVYQAADPSERIDARGWSHWLTVDGSEAKSLKPLNVSGNDGVVRSSFVVPLDLVRLARSAQRIGLHMKSSDNRSASIGYSVDIDDGSASMVRSFLGNCLRGQAK